MPTPSTMRLATASHSAGPSGADLMDPGPISAVGTTWDRRSSGPAKLADPRHTHMAVARPGSNHGTIGRGGVQWMTAGSGLIHFSYIEKHLCMM